MHDMRNAVHRDFQWNRDLLLNLLRGNTRPLRNYVHVVVRDVRIRLDRKLVKRYRSPDKQQKGRCQDKKTIVQREVDKLANHLLLHRILEHQSVLNHLCAGFNAGDYFLHIAREYLPGGHFDTPELLVARRYIDPIPVVQM
jgi:hypothetical protein